MIVRPDHICFGLLRCRKSKKGGFAVKKRSGYLYSKVGSQFANRLFVFKWVHATDIQKFPLHGGQVLNAFNAYQPPPGHTLFNPA